MKPGEEPPSDGQLHQSFSVRLSVPKLLLIDLDVRSGIWCPPSPTPTHISFTRHPRVEGNPTGTFSQWAALQMTVIC